MTSVPIPITLKSRRKASLVQGESSVLIYERHNSGGLREKERASHHGKGKKKNLIKEGKKEGMNLNELCPIIVLKEDRGFTWSAEALNSEFVRENYSCSYSSSSSSSNSISNSHFKNYRNDSNSNPGPVINDGDTPKAQKSKPVERGAGMEHEAVESIDIFIREEDWL